jgi:hypothetical protein
MIRFFVTTDDRGEREVDKAEYVDVERQAGFRNTMGWPGEPATSGFSAPSSGGRLSGRAEYVDEELSDN